MKTRPISAIHWLAVSVMLLGLSSSMMAQRGKEQYLCSEPNPESICNAGNTCGSSSTACTVGIKRTANAASVTPNTPDAKDNQPFCVKVGTKVTWKSESKNTGFVLDFGPDFPFGSEAIIGGSDRAVPSVAKKKGCYKYSVGACVSGAIYGMCGTAETELIITGGQ
jgi:hypothetical protein